jgi:outer membrane protein
MKNNSAPSCRTVVGAALLVASAMPALAEPTTIKIGYININPHSSAGDLVGPVAFPAAGGVPTGVSLSVKSKGTLLLAISQGLGSGFEAELVAGVPPTHDVVAKLDTSNPQLATVAPLQGEVIAKVRQFAPTAFVNYRFGGNMSTLRPFVGLGVNYTKFDKTESTAAGNELSGGATRISLSDSTGLAVQAGATWQIDRTWSVNGCWSTADVKSKLTATTAGFDRTTDIKFRPQALSVSVGYSF